VPHLAVDGAQPKRRLGLVGPAALVIGGLLLLGIGAGSAVGINDALNGTGTSTTTTTTHIAASGSASPSPSTATAPSPAGLPEMPTTTSQVPPTSSASPSPSTQVGSAANLVTQAVTANVLATTWAGYTQAMVSDDRGALSTFTTPSALNDSIATLDCGCLSGPMTYSTSAINAPPQSSYPISFMAGLSGTGYNQLSQTWWVVFTKTGSNSPWVIAFIAGYAEGGGLAGLTGFSDLSPTTVQFPLQEAPQAYVDYFQNLDTTGDTGTGLPSNFAQDNILSTEVSDTSRIRQTRLAEGLHETFTHTIDQVSPVFAQVVSGSLYGSMECFSVRSTDVITSANGAPIIQPADQDKWGLLVPPGSYASLTFTQEDDSCVEESFTSGITLNAESGGTYTISTTPSQ
jgi:hypothetical protein